MIVVDASVLIAVLTDADGASGVQRRLLQAGAPLHVPEFVDLEVANVLRRLALRPATRDRAQGALSEYRRFPLRRYPHLPFLDRIWALRHTVSAYDAAYVSLAEYLDAPLLTCDRKLANASGHGATVELV